MSNLRHGFTIISERNKSNPKWRAHVAWLHMKRRCTNPADADKKAYSGVKFSPEWRSFERFIADMGLPADGMSLDRIDPHGNYCKENCRWATRKQQNSNKRRHRYIEHNGERKLMWQWAEDLGMPLQTIRNRFYRGWPVELVLSKQNYTGTRREQREV